MNRRYHLKLTWQILIHGYYADSRWHAIKRVWRQDLFLFADWWKWRPVGPIRSDGKYSIQKMEKIRD